MECANGDTYIPQMACPEETNVAHANAANYMKECCALCDVCPEDCRGKVLQYMDKQACFVAQKEAAGGSGEEDD